MEHKSLLKKLEALEAENKLLKSKYNKLLNDDSIMVRDIMENIPGFAFIKDINLNYVSANKSFCDLLKIPYDEIKGKTDYDIFPKDLAEKYINDDKKVLKSGKQLLVEEITVDANKPNYRFVVATRKLPWYDTDGKLMGIYGLGFDISDLKHVEQLREAKEKAEQNEKEISVRYEELAATEEELRVSNDELLRTSLTLSDSLEKLKKAKKRAEESEESIRSIINLSPFPVAVANIDTDEIFYWSHSAVELFGFTPKYINDWYTNAYPDPEYREEVRKRWTPFIEIAINSNIPVNTGEYRITCSNKKEIICEIYATFVDGRIIVTFNDITERINISTELLSLNEKLELRVAERTQLLEDSKKELESFVYSISHDLRAPLRSIMGFTEIISKRYTDNFNEEAKEYFGYILEASKNMNTLIDDLLKISRLIKGSLIKEMISLNDVLNYVQNSLNQDIVENKAQIIIPNKLPSINSDSSLLGQIFMNLIQNAIIYRKKELNPIIKVDVTETNKDVIIKIIDNGQGIADVHFEKIFNIFQRLHSQDEYPGTGIGLTIVKKAVTALEGKIMVESEVNKGSIFTVQLPKK